MTQNSTHCSSHSQRFCGGRGHRQFDLHSNSSFSFQENTSRRNLIASNPQNLQAHSKYHFYTYCVHCICVAVSIIYYSLTVSTVSFPFCCVVSIICYSLTVSTVSFPFCGVVSIIYYLLCPLYPSPSVGWSILSITVSTVSFPFCGVVSIICYFVIVSSVSFPFCQYYLLLCPVYCGVVSIICYGVQCIVEWSVLSVTVPSVVWGGQYYLLFCYSVQCILSLLSVLSVTVSSVLWGGQYYL